MKRIMRCLWIALVISLSGAGTVYALADGGTCNFVGPLLNLDKNKVIQPDSGAIVLAWKDSPNWVVVIGQDPEQEGVTLKVRVVPQDGTIQFDRWVSRDRCTHYRGYQPGRDDQLCNPVTSPDYDRYGDYGYYYTDPSYSCERTFTSDQNIKVARTMASIKIWLEPGKETGEWLGWSPTTSTGRSALRFIYPEKWMVGNWTEGGGFETRGTVGNIGFGPGYYEKWLEKMGSYDFLAGDSMADKAIWSVTLPVVASPIGSNNYALGLIGTFDSAPNLPSDVGGYARYFDCPYISPESHAQDMGWTWSNANISCENDPLDESRYRSTYDYTMNHVPLDLPGEWHIGVMIQMEQATFSAPDAKRGTIYPKENTGWVERWKWFKPSTAASDPDIDEIGYNMDKVWFMSYIMLSTPCNGQEAQGCFDDSP